MLCQILHAYHMILGYICDSSYWLYDVMIKYHCMSVRQFMIKQKNHSKFDDFSKISFNHLGRFESIPMRESLPGSGLAEQESPRAKQRASGSWARSKIRPCNYHLQFWKVKGRPMNVFLVLCHATQHPAHSVCLSSQVVSKLVPFLLFRQFDCSKHSGTAQMPFSITAPAHPQATTEAVFLALFKYHQLWLFSSYSCPHCLTSMKNILYLP